MYRSLNGLNVTLGNRKCKYARFFFANITGKMQIIKDYHFCKHLFYRPCIKICVEIV